ncbi:SEC-C metal-binding domain-containing protein [Brevibacillus brevis]
MNIGRNTPCPCGSGEKYKKRCLVYYEGVGFR